MTDTIEIYRSGKGKHCHRFRVRAFNGQIVLACSEGYTRPHSVRRAIERLQARGVLGPMGVVEVAK